MIDTGDTPTSCTSKFGICYLASTLLLFPFGRTSLNVPSRQPVRAQSFSGRRAQNLDSFPLLPPGSFSLGWCAISWPAFAWPGPPKMENDPWAPSSSAAWRTAMRFVSSSTSRGSRLSHHRRFRFRESTARRIAWTSYTAIVKARLATCSGSNHVHFPLAVDLLPKTWNMWATVACAPPQMTRDGQIS